MGCNGCATSTVAPVANYAPVQSGCNGCGQVSYNAPVANYSAAPTYTSAAINNCGGCGTTYAQPMMSQPVYGTSIVNGCNGCSGQVIMGQGVTQGTIITDAVPADGVIVTPPPASTEADTPPAPETTSDDT